MDQKKWHEIEPILDKALSIQNVDERREYVRVTCESTEDERQVFNLIKSIRKAEESGFLE